MTTKHTPTPWTNAKCVTKHDNASIIMHNDDWVALACDFNKYERDAEREANAAFIVRAVNSHDSLVNALKSMRRCPSIGITDQESGDTFLQIINAALAKVEAQS